MRDFYIIEKSQSLYSIQRHGVKQEFQGASSYRHEPEEGFLAVSAGPRDVVLYRSLKYSTPIFRDGDKFVLMQNKKVAWVLRGRFLHFVPQDSDEFLGAAGTTLTVARNDAIRAAVLRGAQTWDEAVDALNGLPAGEGGMYPTSPNGQVLRWLDYVFATPHLGPKRERSAFVRKLEELLTPM